MLSDVVNLLGDRGQKKNDTETSLILAGHRRGGHLALHQHTYSTYT